jgi:ATP-binding cassette subfamily B multidrug efflux pump
LGETYSFEEIQTSAQVTNVAGFIEQLPQGYDTQLRERGTNLSGGQKQLLAFARAAIRDPSILVLDEATASLDVGTEALIQEALDRLLEKRTAIIIAHRLSTIRNVDRILVLKRGQLVESGSHEELLQQDGLYASLYKLQNVRVLMSIRKLTGWTASITLLALMAGCSSTESPQDSLNQQVLLPKAQVIPHLKRLH